MTLRFGAVALVALGCTEHAPLDVAKVELERFQGGWYEIAKFPRATQRGCVATTATYRLKSRTELDVYSECREGAVDGPVRRMAARAVVEDTAEPAKLSLDFGGFFGDYWIVDVDAEYRYAAVGHPSRDYLWILSRTPSLDEAEYGALVERVSDKGFEVERLELTPQSTDGDVAPASAESLPSPSDYGCSVRASREEPVRGLVWTPLIALAVLAVRLRRRFVTK